MSVTDNGIIAKRLKFQFDVAHRHDLLGSSVQLYAIPVQNRDQAVCFKLGGVHAGLPYHALVDLTISKDRIGVSVYTIMHIGKCQT